MPTDQASAPRLKTNLDTDFLKLIAIISMAIDHIGGAFFPQYPVFRWIGRLAFPVFAYCLTVGLLYTHDIKKYLIRLGIFALVSQPFYIFAFHPWDWRAEWWLPALWSGYPEDPKSLIVAGHAINWTIFGVLSVFPIYLPSRTGIKIPKWFFYGFYPVHLAAIGILRVILKV